jgi:hypothetical protein
MKKFIVKTVWFILPLILISIPMEFLLRQIPNEYVYKKEYLDSHSNEIQTLVLGSSHFYFGIDPVYFSQNTFNAAHVSQSLDFDFEILKKYQNNFNRLKNIILPISYFTLRSKLEVGVDSWRIKNYVRYYGMDISLSLSAYIELLDNLSFANIKRLASLYIMKNPNIPCSELGWGTSYNSSKAQNLKITGKTAALRHSKDKDYKSVFHENIITLTSFIEFCEKHNVNLIFVTPPAYVTYRENLDKEQLSQVIETITEMTEKHANCQYINLLDSPIFTADDFYDADHLNEIGAKKLSLLIDKEIEKL